MSFSAYTGSTGEGKTHEVVDNVIVKCYGEGRRILTNVTGLNVEKINEYLRKKGIDDSQFGEIVTLPPIEKCIGRFAIINEIFHESATEPEAKLDVENSLVHGGDVVVLDEVWRIWKQGEKIHPNDEKFWRMHRHILHPVTNVSTDIVIISQNFADLNRVLRGLVHQRFHMKKHTALGFTKKYVVQVFDIGARKPHITIQRTYNPEIFALYKSHSLGSGAGEEKQIDGRSNLLKRALMTTIPLTIFFLIGAGYYLYSWFTAPQKKAEQEKSKNSPTSKLEKSSSDNSPKPTTPHDSSPQQNQEDALAKLHPWRVVGYAASPNGIVLLIDVQGSGLRQVIAPSDVIISGQYVESEIDGKIFGSMSGYNNKKIQSLTSQ
jgi:zona occludens toxin